MNAAAFGRLLLPLVAAAAAAQSLDPMESISVAYAVDGKTVACKNLRVELRIDGRTIIPKLVGKRFAVPEMFMRKASEWPPAELVDVRVRCGKDNLEFPGMRPSWVSPGEWRFGIEYPPHWIDRSRGSWATDTGTWVSYFAFECNGCDPGVETMISHAEAPRSVVRRFLRRQPGARGEGARDIAYALAVLGSEYQRNRDYLVGLLSTCLSRPKDQGEDDVCDRKLWDYLKNLYWRGDNSLLDPLLRAAEVRGDVILEAGWFYADLLDRHMTDALKKMAELPVEKRKVICRLAGEEFMGDPQFERVAGQLRGVGSEMAEGCLRDVESAARR